MYFFYTNLYMCLFLVINKTLLFLLAYLFYKYNIYFLMGSWSLVTPASSGLLMNCNSCYFLVGITFRNRSRIGTDTEPNCVCVYLCCKIGKLSSGETGNRLGCAANPWQYLANCTRLFTDFHFQISFKCRR